MIYRKQRPLPKSRYFTRHWTRENPIILHATYHHGTNCKTASHWIALILPTTIPCSRWNASCHVWARRSFRDSRQFGISRIASRTKHTEMLHAKRKSNDIHCFNDQCKHFETIYEWLHSSNDKQIHSSKKKQFFENNEFHLYNKVFKFRR